MTANLFLYAAILAAVGGALCYAAGAERREAIGLVLFFEFSFWLRAATVFGNARLGVLPQKFAACFPLDIINQPGGLWSFLQGFDIHDRRAIGQLKFFIEAAANLPGIAFFDNSSITLNLTNSFFGALAGIVVFAYMRRLFDRNTAVVAMLLASFYPAALEFSIFGLRDIILYLFILTNIASLAWLLLRADRRALQIAIYLISLACVGVLRSAFVPFILVLPMFLLARNVLRQLVSIEDRRKRWLYATAAAAAACVVLFGDYAIALHHIGLDPFARPDHLLHDYVEARAARGTPFAKTFKQNHTPALRCVSMSHTAQRAARGVASQYVPFKMYRRMPWVVRETIQIVGFIVDPLPWQLDRWSRGLALFDSAFVAATLYAAWQALRRRREPALHPLQTGLFLSFLLCWLGYGLLVADAGNAFRLRLTVEPFALFGASLYLSSLPWLTQRLDRFFAALPGFTRARE